MRQCLWVFPFLFVFPFFTSAQSWQIDTMATMPERLSNNAVSMGYHNGVPNVYTFAGIDSTRSHTGIHLRSYRYNTQTNTWHTIAPLPDTLGKIAAIASTVKNKIYIIGGFHEFPGAEIITNKVHIYDCNADSFLADGANLPFATGDQSQAVWRDSLIYVISGWGGADNLTQVQIYNPSTDTWSAGTPLPNSNAYKSFGSSGTIVGDTIYYFGGGSATFPYGVQSVFRKGVINPNNPTQITWSTFTWSGWNGYRMAATTCFDKTFWLGGAGVTYLFDGIAYNGTGPASPKGDIICYQGNNHSFKKESGYALPMDLRGIGSVNDTVKYIVGGMHGLTVSNQTLRLRVIPDSIISNIFNIETALSLPFTIAPNPVKATTTIQINDSKTTHAAYTIYSLSGLELDRGNFSSNETLSFDVTTYPAGTYFIKIVADDKIGIQQFIVQH